MHAITLLRQSGCMEYRKTYPWITFELDLTAAPIRFWTLLGDACSKCEVMSGIPAYARDG